ncbi:MAG: rod shape-determining protein RodA [Lachnospiraceae bacterium]|nr:rod shape-determining protein RodA [Lachnospiraceae bacterium]
MILLKTYKLKNVNFKLIFSVIALTILGILVIGSANSDYQSKQIIGMILGILVMVVVALVDYDFVLQFNWVYYFIVNGLLILVLMIGTSVGGATRWIDVGIRFQPSELAKVLLILFFAAYLTQHEDEINDRKFILKTAAIAAIPLVLILKEPDLSTTIVTFLIIAALLFITGLSYKLVGIILAIAVPAVVTLVLLVLRFGESLFGSHGYQARRILYWLRPEDYPQGAYQQQNSIMAIGSGQFIGKGLGNDSAESVKNGNYISEPQTDFIFAVAGEELGFIGSLAIIFLLLYITYQCIETSKKAKDLSGKLICVGMACLIGFQSFVNICVVTGLMPNTGLPLPFVSYGLTSLVTLYAGLGFVLNVGLQQKKY